MAELNREKHLRAILKQSMDLREKIYAKANSDWTSAADTADLSEHFSRLATLEIHLVDRIDAIQKPVKAPVPAKKGVTLKG